jgi:hypothetical protein
VPDQGFVVLDQAPQPGGAWQFRWPLLKLSTVNRIHDLPGMRSIPMPPRSRQVSPCRGISRPTRRPSTYPSIGP